MEDVEGDVNNEHRARKQIVELHQTLRLWISRRRGNAWIDFEDMMFYLRLSRRRLSEDNILMSCIDIANITGGVARKGTFTRLILELEHYKMPLYLENVQNHGFGLALIERHGWTPLHNYSFGIYSLVNYPKSIDCKTCGGSGFSGFGSGYDDVCAECGRQKQQSLG